jgi:hypothetical protein
MGNVIAAANSSDFTIALFGLVGVVVGALATVLVGIVNYRETRSGQVTDRLTRAVEQLGNTNPQVRMGAIYALEQIAYDSKPPLIARGKALVAVLLSSQARSRPRSTDNRHQSYIAYVATLLAALVRSQSISNGTPRQEIDVLKVRAPDVQAALTVLTRPPVSNYHTQFDKKDRLDLSRSDLRIASLRGAQLQGADLTGTQLQGADLRGANLYGAVLKRAQLGPAPGSRYPDGADLRGADLTGADLTDAYLDRAIWSRNSPSWPTDTSWPEEMMERSEQVASGEYWLIVKPSP